MANINEDVLEKVKEQMDIVELVGEYVHLKKSGSNHVGLCPFHNEKTPSFTVSESKQFFHCFGCGEGGDGLAFIMKRENLDFVDALKLLAERYGIPWEDSQNPEAKEEKDIMYEMNREAARYFYKNFAASKIPGDYLMKRGITEEVSRKFGLGYAVDSWDGLMKHMLSKGYKEADMVKAGLASERKDNSGYFDKFRNRIMFPIIDTRGRVIGFGGRVLDDAMPKYLNSPDTPVFNKGFHLYGLNLVGRNSDRKRILLVEGYMDVISLYAGGVDFAVASLGTALTAHQGKLLKRYGESIYICYDRDNAGIKATERAIDILRELEVEPKIVVLPEGMDPDDFIRQKGRAAFQKKMEEALNYVDFKVYILRGKYNLEDPQGKIGFTKAVAGIIRSMKSPVEQDVYMERISDETGITRDAIKQEVRGRRDFRPKKESSRIEPVLTRLPPAHLKAEMDLIGFMIIDREYYERIKNSVDYTDFQDMDCRFCYRLISQAYAESDILDREKLQRELRDDDQSSQRFNEIINNTPNFQASNGEKMLDDLVRTIRHNKLLIEKTRLMEEMTRLEKSGDKPERFMEILSSINELNRKINSLVSREEIN